MARSHLCHTLHPLLGLFRADRQTARRGSAGFAHLWCMKPSTTSLSSPDTTAPTTVPPSKDGVVVTGVFESALSVQQLAEELHVSAQTIYDLRSQGRGPTGFRVGRHLRFRSSEIEAWLTRLEGEDCDRHSGGESR